MKNVVGQIYSGEVVGVDNNYYLVDIGIGIDAILNKEEAISELKVGDVVDVIAAYYVKDDIYVSMKGVVRRKHTEELEEKVQTQEPVTGKVIDYRNNRFIVDLGDNVRGSVYVRNMDTKFIKDGTPYIGNEYNFLVVEKSRRGFEDFELNRRDLIAKEQEAQRATFLEKYHVDDTVKGVVTEVINPGLILDVDGIKCFVPRTEISHVNNAPVNVGDAFDVLITEVQERNVSLKGSIKALTTHPFEQVTDLKVGDIVKGKISRIVDYGIFVELFPNVDGLVHISEVSYEHTKSLEGYEPGQEIEVKVIKIDEDNKKIGLSIKRLLPSPYEALKEKIAVGDVISVLVKRITEGGIRVMIMDNFYTNIINEDIHDFSKVKPTLRINDRLEVVVTEMNDETEKVSLSNEQFVQDQKKLFEESI